MGGPVHFRVPAALVPVLVNSSPYLIVLLLARVLLGIALGGFWSMATAVAIRLVPTPMVPRALSTRHLIELGGLVQKAGLVELGDDDRATLFGAFLELPTRLQEQGQAEEDEHQPVSAADLMTRWRRRGLRAFDADKDDAAA